MPLLSDGAMAKRFYTDFNVDQYSYEDGCFTVKDINVYYKGRCKAVRQGANGAPGSADSTRCKSGRIKLVTV